MAETMKPVIPQDPSGKGFYVDGPDPSVPMTGEPALPKGIENSDPHFTLPPANKVGFDVLDCTENGPPGSATAGGCNRVNER